MTNRQIQNINQFNRTIKLYAGNISGLLNQTGISESQFIAAVSNAVRKNPKLLQCEPSSLFGSIMACAELGLLPTDYKGECYIIPYKNRATLQIGYQGFVTLLYRSGIENLWSAVVRENDEFSYEVGISPNLVHKPALKDRGNPIGAYAAAKINGEVSFQFMNAEEINKIKDLSPAGQKENSPWNSNDPEKWMWQKTCIKQLAKTLPKSERFARAVQIDNAGETGGGVRVNERKQIVVEEGQLSKREVVDPSALLANTTAK